MSGVALAISNLVILSKPGAYHFVCVNANKVFGESVQALIPNAFVDGKSSNNPDLIAKLAEAGVKTVTITK